MIKSFVQKSRNAKKNASYEMEISIYFIFFYSDGLPEGLRGGIRAGRHASLVLCLSPLDGPKD